VKRRRIKMEVDVYVSYMRRIYVSITVHLYYTNPRQPEEYLLYYTGALGPYCYMIPKFRLVNLKRPANAFVPSKPSGIKA
jgi:hypothetical protein